MPGSGKVKEKVVPLPTSLVNHKRPPCRLTNRWLMGMPRPLPSLLRVLHLEPRRPWLVRWVVLQEPCSLR